MLYTHKVTVTFKKHLITFYAIHYLFFNEPIFTRSIGIRKVNIGLKVNNNIIC